MGSKSQSLQELEIDSSRRSSAPPQYLDLDKLKNADDIVAIISQRLSNRVITFAIFKEFERDLRVERTSFIAASLRDSYVEMVKLVLDRIEDITKHREVMEKLQAEAIGKLDPLDQQHCRRILQLEPVRGGRR